MVYDYLIFLYNVPIMNKYYYLLPTFPYLFSADKVFTVFLTITDKAFTDNLKDIESLEFLNLAEKLQVAVRDVVHLKE